MNKRITKRIKEQSDVKDRPKLSKTDLGEAARQMICARLMINGIKVFMPMTEDTPTDLLVLKENGDVIKCQCKYIYPTRRGNHEMPLYATRKNGANRKSIRHVYSISEVDVFLGYCIDNDMVYVVPFEKARGKQRLIFWITRKSAGANDVKPFDPKAFENMFELLK